MRIAALHRKWAQRGQAGGECVTAGPGLVANPSPSGRGQRCAQTGGAAPRGLMGAQLSLLPPHGPRPARVSSGNGWARVTWRAPSPVFLRELPRGGRQSRPVAERVGGECARRGSGVRGPRREPGGAAGRARPRCPRPQVGAAVWVPGLNGIRAAGTERRGLQGCGRHCVPTERALLVGSWGIDVGPLGYSVPRSSRGARLSSGGG